LQYVEAFEAGQPVVQGTPFTTQDMGSLAFFRARHGVARRDALGTWGEIAFDASGRAALGDSGQRAWAVP